MAIAEYGMQVSHAMQGTRDQASYPAVKMWHAVDGRDERWPDAALCGFPRGEEQPDRDWNATPMFFRCPSCEERAANRTTP
jgi:hypothetical protein